jgi:hypothetical protein
MYVFVTVDFHGYELAVETLVRETSFKAEREITKQRLV